MIKRLIFIVLMIAISFALIPVSDTQAAVDPYQDVSDEDTIKVYLLRRIANDTKPTDPAFNIPGYSVDTSKHPKGMFVYAENSAELDNLFKTIARKIKLRLIG